MKEIEKKRKKRGRYKESVYAIAHLSTIYTYTHTHIYIYAIEIRDYSHRVVAHKRHMNTHITQLSDPEICNRKEKERERDD
jgi:hypothetical protein